MVAAGVTCCCCCCCLGVGNQLIVDRKSTRLNSSHSQISYAVFCLKKKKNDVHHLRVHVREASLFPLNFYNIPHFSHRFSSFHQRFSQLSLPRITHTHTQAPKICLV